MLKSTNYVHHDRKKVLKLDVVWPQKEAKNYNEWMQYIHKEITGQCDRTSPLIALTAEEYWTNGSGYSDVFHNDYE